ncbi:MAG: MFS transporter [Gemmiger sp.]|nr:MFS transporter [Gemmiger sp.]
MDIKKQLRHIYAYAFASCLRITNAVWVVLLAARGFTLWQIGLAEGVFHITSLLCEIPSGMAADLMGRRRSLRVSGLMGAAAGVAMVAGSGFGWVCLSMSLMALSYNLISGTQEALTYDSLVQAGCADAYLQVDANVSILQTLGSVVNDLCSLLTGVLGYTGFYLLDAAVALTRTVAAGGLWEPAVTSKQTARQQHPFAGLPARLREHIALSVRFLVGNPAVARKIMANALISLPCYLTLMFLQQRLTELGLPTMLLGLPLLGVELARLLGTTLGRRLHPGSLLKLYALAAMLGGLGTAVAGAAPRVWVAIAGAMLTGAAFSVWLLHAEKSLHDAYPSDQRATLVSVDSMAYSVLMIIASPLVGVAGDAAGSAGAGLCLLGVPLFLAGVAAALCAVRRRIRGKSSAKNESAS